MDANGVKSTTPAGHCRLTPLVPLILDCTFLYHFSVLSMFKLHSREYRTNVFTSTLRSDLTTSRWFSGIAPDVLLGHRERFRDIFTRWVVKVEGAKAFLLGGIIRSYSRFSPPQPHTVFQQSQRNGVL